jgi:hypothetical protein
VPPFRATTALDIQQSLYGTYYVAAAELLQYS